jgi:hypothetical protein
MGEIAGPHERDAFATSPPRKVFKVTVLAAGAGVLRMDMQVRVERHVVARRLSDRAAAALDPVMLRVLRSPVRDDRWIPSCMFAAHDPGVPDGRRLVAYSIVVADW